MFISEQHISSQCQLHLNKSIIIQ